MTIRQIPAQVLAWTDKHPLSALALISVVALLLNIVFTYAYPPSIPAERSLFVARNVAHGRGYVDCSRVYFPFCGPGNEVTASKEPLPVLIFAAVSALTHDSLWAVAFVEIVISLAILLTIFILARHLTDTRTALLAVLFWALYLPAIRSIHQVAGELLATLCVTLGIYFFLRAKKTDRPRDWLAAGACIGLGVLSRSVVLFIGATLALTLIPWNLLMKRGAHQFRLARLKPLALFVAICALVILPWQVRNYVVLGRPVIGSTLTGYNLYRHNYILQTNNYLRYVGSADGRKAVNELLARRADLQGTENEVQMNDVYQEEAKRIILAEPARYLLLSLYRFFPLWFDWGVQEAYGKSPKLQGRLILAQQALLLITAIVGLHATWRRSWLLGLIILIVSVLHMAVVSQLRYLIIVMPLTIILSAIGCSLWMTKSPQNATTKRLVPPA